MTLPNILYIILDKNGVPYIYYDLNDVSVNFSSKTTVYQYQLINKGLLKKQYSMEKEEKEDGNT